MKPLLKLTVTDRRKPLIGARATALPKSLPLKLSLSKGKFSIKSCITIKCCFPSNVVFHQWLSSIGGHHSLEGVLHQKSSSKKRCFPLKEIFHLFMHPKIGGGGFWTHRHRHTVKCWVALYFWCFVKIKLCTYDQVVDQLYTDGSMKHFWLLFFIFALFGLIFWYCGANWCFFEMVEFRL